MTHTKDIESLIRTLLQSNCFHALIIQSPPGWGKTTTVERVLGELGTPYRALGSYSTPLALYRALCTHHKDLLILDDCAGLLTDPTAIALLKAATWTSSGSHGQRRVTWSSASEKVEQSGVDFSGKLIVLTNTVPVGGQIRSFISRSLYLPVSFSGLEIAAMLRDAASHLNDDPIASEVAELLIAEVECGKGAGICFRTFEMGRELARSMPNEWKGLLSRMLGKTSPTQVVQDLSSGQDKTTSQCRAFQEITGMSPRTFYYYKSKQGTEPIKTGLGPPL
jgi:hypothetical protein